MCNIWFVAHRNHRCVYCLSVGFGVFTESEFFFLWFHVNGIPLHLPNKSRSMMEKFPLFVHTYIFVQWIVRPISHQPSVSGFVSSSNFENLQPFSICTDMRFCKSSTKRRQRQGGKRAKRLGSNEVKNIWIVQFVYVTIYYNVFIVRRILLQHSSVCMRVLLDACQLWAVLGCFPQFFFSIYCCIHIYNKTTIEC